MGNDSTHIDLSFLQSGIPPTEQDLYHNGKEMVDLKKTMEQYGVEDDDMLLMQRKRAPAADTR
jgi:hypothetical protein